MMSREEEIEKYIEFHANKFSVRYGYETVEDLMRGMARFCDNNPVNPWISVEDRLPEQDGKTNTSIVVYIKDEKGLSTSAWYNFDTKTWHIFVGFTHIDDDDDTYEGTVTHWMYIPELPDK